MAMTALSKQQLWTMGLLLCLFLMGGMAESSLKQRSSSIRSSQQIQRKYGTQHLRGGASEYGTAGRFLMTTTRTTTRCNSVRPVEDYPAELQLLYVYLVEVKGGGSRTALLREMEDVITFAVADALDDCDLLDRPVYTLKTNTRHAFSKDEFCPPLVQGNSCSVVNGATAILVDSQSAEVQAQAYDAIAKGLNQTDLVQDFSASVVRAAFVRPLRESLVASSGGGIADPTPPGTITATVAVAAASVSFVVASIFCYGLMRREMRHHSEPSVRHKFRKGNVRTIVNSGGSLNGGIGGIRHRRFVRLDELALSSPVTFGSTPTSGGINGGRIGIDSPPQPFYQSCTQSVTWSVSDMTSDSASLHSGVSWTPSNLARIDEGEHEEEEHGGPGERRDHVDTSRAHDFPPLGSMTIPVTRLYGLSTANPVEFVGMKQLGDVAPVEADGVLHLEELAGCRYVEESDMVEEPAFRSVTPDTVEGFPIHGGVLLELVMPDVDDLQVSLDHDEEDCTLEDDLPSILILLEPLMNEAGEDSMTLDSLLADSFVLPHSVSTNGRSGIATAIADTLEVNVVQKIIEEDDAIYSSAEMDNEIIEVETATSGSEEMIPESESGNDVEQQIIEEDDAIYLSAVMDDVFIEVETATSGSEEMIPGPESGNDEQDSIGSRTVQVVAGDVEIQSTKSFTATLENHELVLASPVGKNSDIELFTTPMQASKEEVEEKFPDCGSEIGDESSIQSHCSNSPDV